MLRDPMITCVGDDGETPFKYYVLCDADVASEHVGWVLIVDGPSPLKPQYVTPTEIAGDLHSMGIGDEGMHYFPTCLSRTAASSVSTSHGRGIETPGSSPVRRGAINAENLASSLTKGQRVIVIGQLRQRRFDANGQQRSATEIFVQEGGPSLLWATAEIRRRASEHEHEPEPEPAAR